MHNALQEILSLGTIGLFIAMLFVWADILRMLG
jgi:hypothetical protein